MIRPRKSKSKKNKKRRSQKTEMAEGNLEQFLSGVTASKKTIKDKDVKEKFYGMTEPQYPQFGSGIGHALLDIEGAEFTEGDGMEPGVSILPFDEDSKGNGEYRQMFTLGNDEELEGHKQQGKKPGDHPAAVSSNKTEDSTYDYSAAAKSTENASSNEKVAEANKLNSDYNSVPLNLANISNFKVVIPGGKTYEISRAGGNQPAVTVVPNEETKSDEQASQKYQKSTPKDTSVDTNKDGSTASASSSPSSDSFNEKDTSVKDTAARDADTKTKGVSSTDTSLSTPASAATSSSDIKSVEKASSEKSTDKIPNTDTKTVTEDSSGKNKETTANKEASARQGTMGFETYASPQGAGESVMAFDGADHGGHDMDHPPFHLETQPMTLHVPIEQPVLHASHIEHPIIHEEPIEQPVVHEPVLMHHEEHYPNPPVIHHEDHPPIHEMPHHDDMHVVVEQHVPPPPKPNVTKIEPEIIKVEFLPEGVGVDTAAAKMKASGGGGFIKGKEKTKEVKIVPAASTSSATQDKSATAPDTPKPAAQQAAAVSSKGEVTETKPTAKEIVSKALMEAAAEGLKVQKAESETQSATLSKASKNAAQIEKPQYEAQPVSVQFASEDKSKTQPEAQPATLQLASEEKSKALSEAQPETLQPISDDKSSPKDTKESLKDVNTITTSAISPGNDPQVSILCRYPSL